MYLMGIWAFSSVRWVVSNSVMSEVVVVFDFELNWFVPGLLVCCVASSLGLVVGDDCGLCDI